MSDNNSMESLENRRKTKTDWDTYLLSKHYDKDYPPLNKAVRVARARGDGIAVYVLAALDSRAPLAYTVTIGSPAAQVPLDTPNTPPPMVMPVEVPLHHSYLLEMYVPPESGAMDDSGESPVATTPAKKPLRIKMEQDTFPDSPNDWDGPKVWCFSRNHGNYKSPADLGIEALTSDLPDEDDEDYAEALEERERAEKLFDDGEMFLLDVYSHGGEVWSLHNQGYSCQWDTARGAGVVVLDEDLLKHLTTFEERKRAAEAAVDEWNMYVGGDVWCMTVLVPAEHGNEEDDGDCICGVYGSESGAWSQALQMAHEVGLENVSNIVLVYPNDYEDDLGTPEELSKKLDVLAARAERGIR